MPPRYDFRGAIPGICPKFGASLSVRSPLKRTIPIHFLLSAEGGVMNKNRSPILAALIPKASPVSMPMPQQ
jgi:hypothetical protein